MILALRLRRLLTHILALVYDFGDAWVPWRGLHYWLGDLVFLMLDVMFIAEVHSITARLRGSRGRSLTPAERELAASYFGSSIELQKVRVWEGLGGRLAKFARAFVSFNIINSRGGMKPDLLIHELVHIWQYQRWGGLYIFRALVAQHSQEGYDYGGVQRLYHSMLAGARFTDFNFEQQGDIFQDYYKLCTTDFGVSAPLEESVYRYFIDQVRQV